MDLDEIRTILRKSRLEVWGLIDAAISVALLDHGDELKDRRDGIVERLYSQCRNCSDVNHHHRQRNGSIVQTILKAVPETEGDINSHQDKGGGSPLTPQSIQRDNDDADDDHQEPDPCGGLFDDERTQILRIKEQLEDPDQSENSVVELLQSLADMDITFQALKDTDIGRHVNRLRKHSSNEVRRLVKQLVRKWKDLVDKWVGSNHTKLAPSTFIADGDSPLQQNIPSTLQFGHHHHYQQQQQVPDFAYSPNPQNGSSGSERNNSEPEQRPKAIPKREAPSRQPPQSLPVSASAPPPNRARKESSIDLDRLASARRRLHENYQEAENAKKQRTIQVMDIHDIPKPKNGFIAKNKGGFQGRHHR